MKLGLFWQVLPFYLCIGLIFVIPYMRQQATAVHAEAYVQMAQSRLAAPPQQPVLLSGKPVRIVVPKLGIDLAVVPGGYLANQATWTVSDSQANYAVNSTALNNHADKTLIYGHSNNRVFSQTVKFTPGDIVYVFADNDHVFEYVYVSKTVVKPSQTEILDSLQGAPGLVLISCDGTWNQNRRVMYFNLVRAS